MAEQDQSVRIRRRGPKPVAEDALPLVRGQLAKRGFAEVELVTRWAEIAGAGLAAHCFPHKLSSGTAGATTLTLVADDRASLELQHQAPKLVDRINRYFGRDVVGRIKVVAGELPKRALRPPLRPLTVAEEAELATWVAGIEDAALREALARLGRKALGESRKTAIFKR